MGQSHGPQPSATQQQSGTVPWAMQSQGSPGWWSPGAAEPSTPSLEEGKSSGGCGITKSSHAAPSLSSTEAAQLQGIARGTPGNRIPLCAWGWTYLVKTFVSVPITTGRLSPISPWAPPSTNIILFAGVRTPLLLRIRNGHLKSQVSRVLRGNDEIILG